MVKAIELDPANALYCCLAGKHLLDWDRAEESIRYFDKAIERMDYDKPHRLKAKVLALLGRHEEADIERGLAVERLSEDVEKLVSDIEVSLGNNEWDWAWCAARKAMSVVAEGNCDNEDYKDPKFFAWLLGVVDRCDLEELVRNGKQDL